ncbi:hypothetical protein [Acinetobacter sp. ANC 3813]|uniref:hypothetical protein n=1 Tax=Acinetobacter sp. ANC 3813 TaxID=1977873 RepID=UPI000A34DD40|nr:hypothetical protein [Acinetobacter sp. ANC 3813]OTG88971.1 hypothetical protein B9T34_14145 [Acinetobacter sp. ANC 3813]
MKKLVLILALCMSAQAFAVDMRALRGSNGFVELGDSYSKLRDVLGRPESSFEHNIRDGRGRPYPATTYKYRVDNANYAITIVDGRVYRIDWVESAYLGTNILVAYDC